MVRTAGIVQMRLRILVRDLKIHIGMEYCGNIERCWSMFGIKIHTGAHHESH